MAHLQYMLRLRNREGEAKNVKRHRGERVPGIWVSVISVLFSLELNNGLYI